MIKVYWVYLPQDGVRTTLHSTLGHHLTTYLLQGQGPHTVTRLWVDLVELDSVIDGWEDSLDSMKQLFTKKVLLMPGLIPLMFLSSPLVSHLAEAKS